MKITPLHSLVCDDIRVEKNGKYIMIGIYTGDIQVKSFPATLRICPWTSFAFTVDSNPEPIVMENRIRTEFDDENLEPSEVTAAITFEFEEDEDLKSSPETIEIPQGAVILNVPGPGKLTLASRKRGGKWKQLLEKRIEQD